ncbi:MAG: hypothetical protein ACHQ7N_18175 [Candidatus Methylomirabilales bacterium]
MTRLPCRACQDLGQARSLHHLHHEESLAKPKRYFEELIEEAGHGYTDTFS